MIGCAALGEGTPLVTGPTPRMRLRDVVRRDGSDNLVLVYGPPVANR